MTTSDFGRVAEDGTVYVRVEEVERPVGSYPGATPEEALARVQEAYDRFRPAGLPPLPRA